MAMGRLWEDAKARPLSRCLRARWAHQRPRQWQRGALQQRWCLAPRGTLLPSSMARRFLSPLTGITAGRKIIAMLLVRITGSQLRAGRALAGLTIEDLAARAQLHQIGRASCRERV